MPADQLVQAPSPYSEEIKNVQMVLEVLSIYWKPLRVLVCLIIAPMIDTLETVDD